MSFDIPPHTPIAKNGNGNGNSTARKIKDTVPIGRFSINTPSDMTNSTPLHASSTSIASSVSTVYENHNNNNTNDSFHSVLLDVSNMDNIEQFLDNETMEDPHTALAAFAAQANDENDDDDDDDDAIGGFKCTQETELSCTTESDTWIDDVFNSHFYGNDDTANTTDNLISTQIFLDQVSPASVISPLEFTGKNANIALLQHHHSVGVSTAQTPSPLADKTNIINGRQYQQAQAQQYAKKPQQQQAPVVDSVLTENITEALCAFTDYFFAHHTQRFQSDLNSPRTVTSQDPQQQQAQKIIPRNEYISEYLVKTYGKNVNKKDVTKIINALQKSPTTDDNFIQLVEYTEQLRAKKIKTLESLKIMANFYNPLLAHYKATIGSTSAINDVQSRASPAMVAPPPPQPPFLYQRESSVGSSLSGVEGLTIINKEEHTNHTSSFELNKFKILFNFNNASSSYCFTEYDNNNNKNSSKSSTTPKKKTGLQSINELKNHIDTFDEGIATCLQDLCINGPVSSNLMVCTAFLALHDQPLATSSTSPASSSSSSSSSTALSKKKNFDLSMGKFISSMELLYHVPHLKENSSSSSSPSSILNYQSCISIYNKDQLVDQKTEPIIGFKIQPQLESHTTYNLKIPFQSSFWGGYLTWLLNGSEEDSVSDIVISQTIKDDEDHENGNLCTLIWRFGNKSSNDQQQEQSSVSYEVFEIQKNSNDDSNATIDLQRPGFGSTLTGSSSTTSISRAPVMDSKLISKVISNTNNSSSTTDLLGPPKVSHKRTRSKSFSELDQMYAAAAVQSDSPTHHHAQQAFGGFYPPSSHQQPRLQRAASQQQVLAARAQQQQAQFRFQLQQQQAQQQAQQQQLQMQQQQQQMMNMNVNVPQQQQHNQAFAPPRFPERLSTDFDQSQIMNQSISSAPANQQHFTFFPAPPYHPHAAAPYMSQSANSSPYMIQQQAFTPQAQHTATFGPPPPQPQQHGVSSSSSPYLGNAGNNNVMIQNPPMRFINAPGPINISHGQQPQQLPTPPASMVIQCGNKTSQSRKSSLAIATSTTPATPASIGHHHHQQQQEQQARAKAQHVFAVDTRPRKASRQLSSSSISSVSSSGTIPFASSPTAAVAHHNETDFKKAKAQQANEQQLKFEFYQPPSEKKAAQ